MAKKAASKKRSPIIGFIAVGVGDNNRPLIQQFLVQPAHKTPDAAANDCKRAIAADDRLDAYVIQKAGKGTKVQKVDFK